ncbi:ABC transporter permease [Micrococcales bacterium 31B]|nr:ABC transporter permease [Micrococcales bacterium 31B]
MTGAGPESGSQPSAAGLRSRQRRRARRAYWLIAPGLIYLAVFFVAPLASLVSTSLYVPVPGGQFGQFMPAFNVANYAQAIVGDANWVPLLRSFAYAGIATVATLLIGFPMAYLIAVRLRGRPLAQGILLVLLIAPFFTSFILRTIAWKQILADEGFVVQALRALALLPADGHLTATPFAVVAGITYNFLAFMALPIYAALERLDPRLLEAASDLYASRTTVFRTVVWPLARPGVVAGTLLTFIPAVGDYVNAVLLGNPTTNMIGQVIDSSFMRTGDYPTAAVLSLLLMASIVGVVTLYVRRAGTEDLV